jgi:aldose 1-epimerase
VNEDLPPERLVLAVEGSEVVLAPAIGGSIARWLWRGREMLRDTPPAAFASRNVRLMACYPLVPFSNRIREGRFAFEGTEHCLERNFGDQPHTIHGTGWQRAWEVGAIVDHEHPVTARELEELELSGFDRDAADFVTGTLAIALLEHVHLPVGPQSRAWPFAFAAQQIVTLTPDFLALQMIVENRDERAMPLGFGWHPFFPRNSAEIDVEVAGVWHGDPERLPVAFEAPAPWRLSGWQRAAALDLDHCFRRATGGRIAMRWRDRGVGIELVADDVFRHLVVFSPPDRDFLAVEPVTNMNDAFNEAGRGNPDTGTIVLAPGESASGTVLLRPFLLEAA